MITAQKITPKHEAVVTSIKKNLKSRNNTSSYDLVTFRVLGPENTFSSVTYVDHQHSNYGRWKGIKVGDRIKGISFKRKGLIDADSPIREIRS